MKRNREKDELVGRLAARYASQAERPAPAGCPEPELLAAYVDGGLAGHEVERCERHLATCASCRQMLAEIARAPQTFADTDTSPAVERARAWSWRWLVPAAVTVAAAALWVVLRPATLPPGSVPVQTGQIARADEVGARSKLASPAARALEAPSQAEARAAAPSGAPKGQSAHGAGAEGGPLPPTERGRAEKAAAPAPALAAERPASRAQVPPAAPAKEMLAENVAKAEAQREAPVAVEPPKDAVQAKPAAPAAGRAGVAGGAVAADRMAVAAAPVSEPETTKQLARVARASVENAPVVIRTPDPLRSWRLGPAGTIQRSTDGGHTWRPQTTGITPTMLAGSAPTPLVCWAVGQKGTILRTIDGTTWEMVAAPTSLDLVAVVARDESSATIAASDGQGWVTTDGGKTWQRR